MAKAKEISAIVLASLKLVGTGAYMAQAEGQSLVDAGFASVDVSNVQGDKAFVTLTEAGQKALADSGHVAVKPQFTIRTDIPIPTKRGRGRRGSVYPIETMEVGQSFHIATSAENPDPASRIASSLSNARIKYAVETGEQETVTVKVYKRDAEGVIEKDAEGHRVVESQSEVTRPKTKLGRDWSVASVDASDPEGVGARVWRTL